MFVHTHCHHGRSHGIRQPDDGRLHESLQPCADDVERQIEDPHHDQQERGDRCKLPGQNPVNLLAALVFLAFTRLGNRFAAGLLNETEPHIRHGRIPVQTALGFHLGNDMLQHFLFVRIQLQRLQNHRVALHQLAGSKPNRQTGTFRMILNQMDDGVQTSVHGTVMIAFVTEVLPTGPLLIGGNVDGVFDQFPDALIPGSGNGNHRNTQQMLQRVDINVSAVLLDLVHHVQRNHHGGVHLQQLHGQVEVAFNIGGVHDVDDGGGFLLQHEIAGNDLLTAVG